MSEENFSTIFPSFTFNRCFLQSRHKLPGFFHILSMRMGRGGACLFDRQKRAVVSALNLPEDVMLGDMFLSFTGNRGVLIENYRNIILYTDTALRLQGKNGRLTIEGTCLTIRYYDKEQLFLSGLIRSAVFEPL